MSQPLRVLMICGDYPPALSGVGDYVDRLCEHLVPHGIRPTLLTTASPALPTDAARPFAVMRTQTGWGAGAWRSIVEQARECDLVHIQYPSVLYGRGPAINLLPARLRLAGVPVLVTIHDFRVMRRRWRARVVPMLAAASGVIHVDGGDGPHLRRWCPLRRPPMRCIPIASNAPVLECDSARRHAWRAGLGLADDELAVAYFGILYPHKGVTELLDAVAVLQREGLRLRPVIIGDFDRSADYVAPLTERLTSGDTIWVRGASLPRVSECLHACDMAALPFYSGASFNRSSMLACLQHGLPTVTTDGPATPSNLKDAFDLKLIPPRNAAAVADALRTLAADPVLRDTMRANALRQTSALSWPAVAAAHAETYRQTLATRAGRDGAAVTHPAREVA